MLRSLVTHVILAVTLALFSVACGSNSSPPTSSSSSSSTSTSTSTSEAVDAQDEEQAVIGAYLAAIDAFYLAANPPDPDHPELDATTAGEFREALRDLLGRQHDEGIGARRGQTTANHPSVIAIADDTAQLEDCLDDADIQFDLATGEVVDDSVVHVRFLVELQEINGSWRVTRRDITEELDEPCG